MTKALLVPQWRAIHKPRQAGPKAPGKAVQDMRDPGAEVGASISEPRIVPHATSGRRAIAAIVKIREIASNLGSETSKMRCMSGLRYVRPFDTRGKARFLDIRDLKNGVGVSSWKVSDSAGRDKVAFGKVSDLPGGRGEGFAVRVFSAFEISFLGELIILQCGARAPGSGGPKDVALDLAVAARSFSRVRQQPGALDVRRWPGTAPGTPGRRAGRGGP